MDLFAPCRSCLQCLPFFHLSPPARLAAAAPSSSPPSPHASTATSIDPALTSENLPSPPAAPAVPEQDVCSPINVEEVTEHAKCDKDDAPLQEEEYSTTMESETVPISGIIIAPPVSSPPACAALPEDEDEDDSKTTTLPELPLQVPFINDITFLGSGFMPLQSPITPAPFGAGYPAGQYPPHDQIYHLEHAHSHHGTEDPQHGDENSHHGHESAQHEYLNSHHGHEHSHHGHHHPHHGHDHSHHGHVNTDDDHVPQHSHVPTASDYEVPHLDPPVDDSQITNKLCKDGSHHNAQHHSHDSSSMDDVGKTFTGHTSLDGDHHDIFDISPTPPLEASQSTPDLDLDATVGGEMSAASHTNGASAVLETYHSEPVVLSGDPHDDDDEVHNELLAHSGSHLPAHRRRRDHFRGHFKGIKQQIKQGGHHLKEEGSKHMQTIIENMNKQAQQIEQSGSFFMVPRANNN